MFEIGEFVIYGLNGICRVQDITHIDMAGSSKDTLYYLLLPVNNSECKVYVPVDNDKVTVRKVLTDKEAWELIDEIPEIDEMWVQNDKQREGIYKTALKTCDCRELVKIIKTSYTRKQERLKQGKKATATDDKYLKQAKENLYNELAFVLGKEKSEMEQIISEHIKIKQGEIIS